MPRLDMYVTQVRTLTATIKRFRLEARDKKPLPDFAPGAHIDLHLPDGKTRSYSLISDGRNPHFYDIAVLKSDPGRGGSCWIHASLAPGTGRQVSAPQNGFELIFAPYSLLLAGGIGITPILAMADCLRSRNADFELHYCCRQRPMAAFLPELAEMGEAVQLHFDNEPDSLLDVPALLSRLPPETHLYVCGPAGFMDHVLCSARALGWEASRLHGEYFGRADVLSDEGEFELLLAHSDKRVTVQSGESAVQALSGIGVTVPVSCEQGICGTCVLRVLEGRPLHRDLYFTDTERATNQQFTPCCSRSRDAVLVLDL